MRIVAALFAATLTCAAAAEDAGSPACALMTDEVAAAWGETAQNVNDGGPARYGMSSCSWSSQDFANLIVTLMEGEQIAQMGGPERTFDMYLKSFGASIKSEPEVLDGIGDKATLLFDGEGDMRTAVLMILKGERVLTISASRIDHDIVIAIARAIDVNF